MKAHLYEPTIAGIHNVPRSEGVPFPVVDVTDYSGGTLSLYVGDNWEHWDAMVAAVNEYRGVK